MDFSDILMYVIKEGNIVSVIAIGILFIFQQIWNKKTGVTSDEIIDKLNSLAATDLIVGDRLDAIEEKITISNARTSERLTVLENKVEHLSEQIKNKE